jgi:hypothetical protein
MKSPEPGLSKLVIISILAALELDLEQLGHPIKLNSNDVHTRAQVAHLFQRVVQTYRSHNRVLYSSDVMASPVIRSNYCRSEPPDRLLNADKPFFQPNKNHSNHYFISYTGCAVK